MTEVRPWCDRAITAGRMRGVGEAGMHVLTASVDAMPAVGWMGRGWVGRKEEQGREACEMREGRGACRHEQDMVHG